MFEEQVEWAADAGVDYVIAETFSYGAEAKLALDIIKAAGLARRGHDDHPSRTAHARRDDAGGLLQDAGRRRGGRGRPELHPRAAHDAAADRADRARGQRAGRGAAGALSDAQPAADLPVAARQPLRLHSGRHAVSGGARSVHLQPLRDRRIRQGKRLGSACATSACAAGRCRITSAASPRRSAAQPPASRYSADMSKHAYFGNNARLKKVEPRIRREADATSW